jgi:hypothetical protein
VAARVRFSEGVLDVDCLQEVHAYHNICRTLDRIEQLPDRGPRRDKGEGEGEGAASLRKLFAAYEAEKGASLPLARLSLTPCADLLPPSAEEEEEEEEKEEGERWTPQVVKVRFAQQCAHLEEQASDVIASPLLPPSSSSSSSSTS